MPSIHRATLAGLVLSTIAACAITPTLEEREQSYLSLSEDHFRSTLNVVDDPLNPSINISTRESYQDYQFSFGPKDDQFLRGMKFRDTGKVVLQGYVTSDINGIWLSPVSITFEHTLSTRPVDRIGFDANRCSSYGCMHYEEMVFALTLEELDVVIAALEQRGETTLKFRIKGQNGVDRDGRFHANELKAFRGAVRETFANQVSP
tara:strand:- start:355 stop:969 length:615 start_codon:yes stop_codon:yes gene_type:complete